MVGHVSHGIGADDDFRIIYKERMVFVFSKLEKGIYGEVIEQKEGSVSVSLRVCFFFFTCGDGG